MKAKEKLRKLLIKHLKGAKYEAQDQSALESALEVHPKERKLLRAVLQELEADGRIKKHKKGGYTLRKKGVAASSGGGEIIGTIRFQAQGQAFVADEAAGENSRWILIPVLRSTVRSPVTTTANSARVLKRPISPSAWPGSPTTSPDIQPSDWCSRNSCNAISTSSGTPETP